MSEYAKIILKSGKDDAVRRFHPWIFSGAIKDTSDRVSEGDIVEVFSSNDEYLATGHCQIGSIAIRLFSFNRVTPDYSFWKSKLEKAYKLRELLNLTNNPQTNTYRLVHAEGDGMPGLIVDYYNGTAVLQFHSVGMHLIKQDIADALKEIYGEKLVAVYDKSAETVSKTDVDKANDGYLYGKKISDEVKENGYKFHVDWETGQKTGFFIDQRENRRLIEKYAANKSVLNMFCYTGAFSVYASKAGATQVHSVDSSKKAIELTDKNILLNDINSSLHQSFVADAMDFMKDIHDKYDVIILDPPAFAKHNSAKHQAIQAYRRINVEAIRQVKKNGIIFTFSYSQVVDKYLFQSAVMSAAIVAGRNVRILHQLSQPPDHSASAFHPEGEYLKGLVLYVE